MIKYNYTIRVGIAFISYTLFIGIVVFLYFRSELSVGVNQLYILGAIAVISIIIVYRVIYLLFVTLVKTQRLMQDLVGHLSNDSKGIWHHHYKKPLDIEINELIIALEKANNREYLESMLKKQAQLDNLQSQINPHFLYNILDSIRGDVLSKGLYDTADMIEALSQYFRYGIGSSVSLIPFEEELKNVENYMKIQQYRFGERIELIKVFDENNPHIAQTKIPKMTLQPLVENAITHGIEGRLTKGKIVLRVMLTDKRFLITVEDNGIGMPVSRLATINRLLSEGSGESKKIDSDGTGVALLNVSERIKLLHGNSYGLFINSTEGFGTEAHVTLPYNEGDLSEDRIIEF